MKELVTAIINESDNGLTKTSVIKLMYLADYYSAELDDGNSKITNIVWIFHKFGPYSETLDNYLDQLHSDRHFEFQNIESNGHQFELIKSNIPSKKPTLVDLTLPPRVIRKLKQAIRKYQYNLKELLNYVYFFTTPMEDAKPGDILNFDSCYTKNARDYRHITIPLPEENIAKAKAKIANILNRRRNSEIKLKTGPIDDVYLKGISALNEQSNFVLFNGSAKINLP